MIVWKILMGSFRIMILYLLSVTLCIYVYNVLSDSRVSQSVQVILHLYGSLAVFMLSVIYLGFFHRPAKNPGENERMHIALVASISVALVMFGTAAYTIVDTLIDRDRMPIIFGVLSFLSLSTVFSGFILIIWYAVRKIRMLR